MPTLALLVVPLQLAAVGLLVLPLQLAAVLFCAVEGLAVLPLAITQSSEMNTGALHRPGRNC